MHKYTENHGYPNIAQEFVAIATVAMEFLEPLSRL